MTAPRSYPPREGTAGVLALVEDRLSSTRDSERSNRCGLISLPSASGEPGVFFSSEGLPLDWRALRTPCAGIWTWLSGSGALSASFAYRRAARSSCCRAIEADSASSRAAASLSFGSEPLQLLKTEREPFRGKETEDGVELYRAHVQIFAERDLARRAGGGPRGRFSASLLFQSFQTAMGHDRWQGS